MSGIYKRKHPRVIELDVGLEYTRPRVWRRLWVLDSLSMYQLHEIIQVSMGWMHSHLFMFRTPGFTITEPSPENDWIKDEFKDARKTKLGSFLKRPGDSIIYEYDFGDSWVHVVRFEREVEESEVRFGLPRCVGGENACPPEDCGGFPGFDRVKKALAKPSSREYREMIDWLDIYYPNYDPKEFSLGAVNKILKIGASKYLRIASKFYG